MKIERKKESALVILDRKYNNGLINALFFGKDLTGHFFALNYFMEEKRENWFELANSYKFQQYTNGIFNRFLIYDKRFVREMTELSSRFERVYIFANNAIFQGPVWYGAELRKIKKRCPNVYFVFFYIDIINSKHSRKANLLLKKNPDLFDLVYTSDMSDALTYGLLYHPLPYAYSSSECASNFLNHEKKGLSFCANIKERSTLILEVLKGCIKNDISTSMALFSNDGSEKQMFLKYDNYVSLLNHFIDYDESLCYTLNANCILDIVQNGQTALSMRPYEAVVFNKKLLTNNSSILDFEFYNENYIQLFSKPENIDWEWVKKDIPVDYGYKGEFSPVYLWNDIEKRL